MASTLQEDGRKGTGTEKRSVGTGVWLPPSIYTSAQSQPSPKPARTRGTRSRSAQQPRGSHTAPATNSVRSFLDLSSLGSTTSTTRSLGSWCSSYGSYQAFDASGGITDTPMGQTPPMSPYAAGASPGAPFLGAPFAGSDAPVRPLPGVNGPSTAMPFGQLASSAAYAPQECLAMPAACAPEQPCTGGNSLSPYGMYGCASTSAMALPQHSSMLAPASLPLQLLLPQQQLGATSQVHLPALSAAPAALGSFSQPLQASAATDSLSDALLMMQLQLQAGGGGLGATSPVQDGAPSLAYAHTLGGNAEPLMGFDCQPLVPHAQAQGLIRHQWQLSAAAFNPAGPACSLAMPTAPGALAAAEVADCEGDGDLDMLSAVVDMRLELLLAMREELLAKRRMSAAMGAGMLM